MHYSTATAIAHPNIALIKYWGNRDPALRLPTNGSISMNLSGLCSRTRVTFDSSFEQDNLRLNGKPASKSAQKRADLLLDRVRLLAGLVDHAWIESTNNFPTGTGIASSASGFAALALAASTAAGLDLVERDLSRLARRASGSACRSIPAGFVEWQAGMDDETSFAFSIAPQDHWALVDCIAVVSQIHKATTSQEGHALAESSPLQSARVASTPDRLHECKRAIVNKDFNSLAEVLELDSNMMHAVMMTSVPTLLYWLPGTIQIMQAVHQWRKSGLAVCYTIDAGPNVHVICPSELAQEVVERLKQLEGIIQVIASAPGGPARLSAELSSPFEPSSPC